MKWQRRNYKTGKIQKDHLDRLNEIGFPWLSHHSNSWEQKFNELVAFKQKHGHFSVSKEVNPGLNSWVRIITLFSMDYLILYETDVTNELSHVDID